MGLALSVILVPVFAGLYLLLRKEFNNRNSLLIFTGLVFLVEGILTCIAWLKVKGLTFRIFDLTRELNISLKLDTLGMIFSVLIVLSFTAAGFFSFEYMKHEENEKRYYSFYLLSYGALQALCFSENLLTYYAFFELLTIFSFALVLHNGSREAIMAGLKYLFYSFCGAYMVVFGFYFICQYAETLSFTYGGVFSKAALTSQKDILLVCVMLMIVGFSVKAGMFPLHAWLPTAHPVAPAPASAVLSGVIAKAGVLGVIRTVFYIFGEDFIAGTIVHKIWIVLTLITVFMGSMLAYREDVLKKRLAYSTVSQISYILFGLSTLNATAFKGSVIHVLAHGFVKTGLFLVAGAIIYKTGKTKVSELRGIGKQMPVTMWCFTILSLGLVGIPPTGGFISKWFLATGALKSGIGVFSVIGPVILLISALLTAGYLFPISINGFLPGDDFDYEKLEDKEPSLLMVLPLIMLTLVSVLIGIFTI